MTTIDTNELRKLAEAATPGPWRTVPNTSSHRGTVAIEENGLYIETIAQVYCGATSGHGADNAAFIASANPSTILALLDDLAAMAERAEKAERGLCILRECTAAERDRVYGYEMAKIRAELARRTVERDSHCEHANQESARASDYAESNESLRTALAHAEATIAKLREAIDYAGRTVGIVNARGGLGYAAHDALRDALDRLDAARKEVG